MARRISIQNVDGTWRVLSPEEYERFEELKRQNGLLYAVCEALRLADLKNPIMADRVVTMLIEMVETLATFRWARVASPDAAQHGDSAESEILRKLNGALDEVKAFYKALSEHAARKQQSCQSS